MTTKHTLSWKKKKYSQACRIMDNFTKQANLCNIKHNGTRITCNRNHPHRQLCCNGCKHISSKGCTVKSLACKLNYCELGVDILHLKLVKSQFDKRRTRLIKLREIIKTFFHKHDIPIQQYRESMKDTFKIYKTQQEWENQKNTT